MKSLLFAAALIFAAGCGDGNDTETKPKRIVKPGAILKGPVGGTERYHFSDGSILNFPVSGFAALHLEKGVVLGSTFPATVTFSVRNSSGVTIANDVEFPRILVNSKGEFQADVSTGTANASIAGMFQAVTDETLLDLQGFSYSLPVTVVGVTRHNVIFSGSQFRQDELRTQP